MTSLLVIFPWMMKLLLLDFITNPSKIEDRTKLKQKIIFGLKVFLFIVLNLNMLMFGLSFGSLMFQKPFKVNAFVIGFLTFMHFFTAVCRCVIVVANKSYIVEILQLIPQNYGKEFQEKYKLKELLKKFKFYRQHSLFLLVSILLSVLLVSISHLVEDNHEVELSLPFGMSNKFRYWLSLLWIHVVHMMFQVACLTIEILLYGMITILAIEFKMLAHKFENLKDEVEKNAENEIKMPTKWEIRKNLIKALAILTSDTKPSTSDQHIKSKRQIKLDDLKPLIERHKELFKARDLLEKVFSIIFLIRFIHSSFVLCFLAFQVTIFDHDRYFFINGLLRHSRFIFFQCYFGQMIKDAGESISCAISRIRWEELTDENVKKTLLFILIRSQKSAAFRIVKTFEITLNQYAKIFIPAYIFYVFSVSVAIARS